VRDVLFAGPAELGVLTAAAGAGAVIGAITAASVPAGRQRVFLLAAALLLPIATAAFAFSRSYALSFGLLIGVGACLVALETSGNALLLLEVKEEFRGRVMSLFSLGGMGAPRLGGLQAGWVASRWGAPLALGLDAACMLFGVALPIAVLLGRRRALDGATKDYNA
jgi:MFS family permease